MSLVMHVESTHSPDKNVCSVPTFLCPVCLCKVDVRENMVIANKIPAYFKHYLRYTRIYIPSIAIECMYILSLSLCIVVSYWLWQRLTFLLLHMQEGSPEKMHACNPVFLFHLTDNSLTVDWSFSAALSERYEATGNTKHVSSCC